MLPTAVQTVVSIWIRAVNTDQKNVRKLPWQGNDACVCACVRARARALRFKIRMQASKQSSRTATVRIGTVLSGECWAACPQWALLRNLAVLNWLLLYIHIHIYKHTDFVILGAELPDAPKVTRFIALRWNPMAGHSHRIPSLSAIRATSS